MQSETSPPAPDAGIRAIPLSRLALAPENVRKTPPDPLAGEQLQSSIAAHGLLENLVVRAGDDGDPSRFLVVAGGRRLAALQSLAAAGDVDTDHPVPCRVVADGEDGAELSLAENAIRIAMHPADQVTAFSRLAASGLDVSFIATRFGMSERVVEQRLRLGNIAPELLAACRGGKVDLATLQAFAVTTDHARQLAVWEEVSGRGYRVTPNQVRRLLTEERIPANAAMARFVGVKAYEAAGGAVMRDLFADEHENGVWLEDPELLRQLAMEKLESVATELETRWRWAETMPEPDWNVLSRLGRVRPRPGEPTDAESAEVEKLRTRREALNGVEEEDWTESMDGEYDNIETRLAEIDKAVSDRATFRREDFSLAGCVATIGREGKLQVVQGLVKPEDMPKAEEGKPSTDTGDANGGGDTDGAGSATEAADKVGTSHVRAPMVSTPAASPVDPRAKARAEAGVGLGLADDLRAIRTALVKTHLAGDFAAAFDLMVFQSARAVFQPHCGYSEQALDITTRETPDRPSLRVNDEDFADWSPGEAELADWSDLPLAWLEEEDDAAQFTALRALSWEEKKKLFAAAVARTVRGQLAFEHGARPEFEATVARLDIDFAGPVRPTAEMLWSRLRKDRLLEIGAKVLGGAWAANRAKYTKKDLAAALEKAFAAGLTPLGVDPAAHGRALAWTPPGFAAFDAGGVEEGDAENDGAGTETGAAPVAEVTRESTAAAEPMPDSESESESESESVASADSDQESKTGLAPVAEIPQPPSAAPEPDPPATEPPPSAGSANESAASGVVDSDTPVSGNGAATTVEADPVSVAARSTDRSGNGNGAGPDPVPANGNGPPAPETAAAGSGEADSLPANGGTPPAAVVAETESTEIPAFPRNPH